MNDPQLDQRFDSLAVQVHDWTDSAVALDEGHFPNELLNELADLIDELKAFLEEAGPSYGRADVTELFVTPEMAEVIQRFSRVRNQSSASSPGPKTPRSASWRRRYSASSRPISVPTIAERVTLAGSRPIASHAAVRPRYFSRACSGATDERLNSSA